LILVTKYDGHKKKCLLKDYEAIKISHLQLISLA